MTEQDRKIVSFDPALRAIEKYDWSEDVIRGIDYFSLLENALFMSDDADPSSHMKFLQDKYHGLEDAPEEYYFGIESQDVIAGFRKIDSVNSIRVERVGDLDDLQISVKLGPESLIVNSNTWDWDYYDKNTGISSYFRAEERISGSKFDPKVIDFIEKLKKSLRDEEWTEYAKVEREVAPIEPGDIREVETEEGKKRLVLVGWSSSSFETEGMPLAATCMLIGDVKNLMFFDEQEDLYLRKNETVPFPIVIHTGLIGSIGNKHLSEDRVGRVDEYTMMAIYRKIDKTWSSGKSNNLQVRISGLDVDDIERNVVRIQDYSDRHYFQAVPVINPHITDKDRIDHSTKEMFVLLGLQAESLRDL